MDYVRYPIRDESTLRGFVQFFLSGAGVRPRLEEHNSRGGSDLDVTVGNRHWVFEFKVVKDKDDSKEKLHEAEKQMVERQYGTQTETEELIRLALVFSIKERKFIHWKQC